MSSIFNINDTSNYNSILSQSKALKESKEKVSFANTLIKENLTKLNELNTKNSQSLIKSEILSNTNPLEDTLQNSIYTLKFKQGQTSNAVSMAYGYGVDANGYMSEDFNKAAGLPEGFKIHKSTLEEIERYNEDAVSGTKEYLGVDKYFTSFDMAATIKQYYNMFSQALSQTFPSDKTSFSEADLNSLPSGYAFNNIKFDVTDGMANFLADFSEAQITNVYQTPEQLKEANEIYFASYGNISGIHGEDFGLSLQDLKDTYYNNGNEWEFNPDMSVYPQNEDGTYSKEALFMSFLRGKAGTLPIYSPNTTSVNPIVQAYNIQMAKESSNGDNINFDDILTGKFDYAAYLRHYSEICLEKGIFQGDLYAYENNISVGNTFDPRIQEQFDRAEKNGWKPSESLINSFANSIVERLRRLTSQTRVA